MLDALEHRAAFFSAIESTEFRTPKGVCGFQEWKDQTVSALVNLRDRGNKLFFIGNGASAAMSSHFSTDFTKNGNFQGFAMSDPALLTCFSNDYSYEDAFKEMFKRYFKPGDGLVAISSSGNSKNILRAATLAKELSSGNLFTFNGFKNDNILKTLGDYNVYVPKTDYGFVESAHSYFLHVLIDFICGIKL